jgi:MFS family permease
LTSCALHLVYGRLSDIFGRKQMLQIAVFFLAFGNLLCGFAKTPVQLYIFRAISGMGGGGINGIAMVIVSDIVPLKDRGKYQGFISAACSTGSAIVSRNGHHQ